MDLASIIMAATCSSMVLLCGIGMKVSFSEARKTRQANLYINNNIADLIEDGSLSPRKDEDGGYLVVRNPERKATNDFTGSILSYGMGEKLAVSTKEFHSGIYENRQELVDYLESNKVEIPTASVTPEDRINRGNEAVATLLPLLILGDADGKSTSSSNDTYVGDGDYAGTSDSSSDGGGGGGDGGDGGGGGGGD